ncbi:4-chlorobenzoate--CoA ligase [Variovorax paradoxus]|jgi:2-furoate---CoA ligase|uniref:AMP-binding protein n=1 Tax=Variovorax paradoxus TaxID=34073 RepID=UPI0006E55EFA|nr:4-chlorobenzoate--CoA ligase [Variovorax paradoxus]KPV10593.1 4-chlorobenzoate--CoA ligase [Variovorax paradoxus]KPV12986.1 4-chlorobenzoate--CoA ligase [Variovorax paradoxus]KPV25077.1 4-chlorobenzoate--CoA ligase [Variovorax paradoxus]KPV36214.1 4-chlorobenzoate--CoA ligase [Variovorax paradoxus]
MLDLGTTFLQSVERSPHAMALVDGAVRLTYLQWHERVVRVAGSLAALGLRRGDRLLSVMQNRHEAATLHWACQLSGIVIVPLNWRAKAEEIDYCIADAQAKAVFFEPVSEAAVRDSGAARGLPCIGAGAIGEGAATAHWDAFCSGARDIGPIGDESTADAQDISLMLYTSGTTGKAKGVPRRHRHERAAALAHVAQNQYGRGECTLGVMPLYHTMGVRSLLAMALVDGCFVCLPRFDTHQALALIKSERVTCLYLVPTLYHDMLAQRERDGGGFGPAPDIASVRKLGFAGAPMHDALLQRLQRAFEPELFVNHYGSSEVYTFSIDPDAVRKPGSAGRAGLNTRLRVVRLDATGSSEEAAMAAALEEGQIVADLRGDEAFEGYWQRPDADAKSLRDGWYFTGDTGYFDADGDLFVTGRVDDMIISGGENISPLDIESVISLCPGVGEVAVAGLSDPRWGQRVVAFVTRADDSNELDAQALDAHCRRSDLPNFKRPREYVFLTEIPKSPVGKILRRKLVAGEYETAPDGR